MSTVYIVTSGEDNSYEIEAVFASKADAEAHVKKCLWNVPYVDIEEHEVR